MKLTITLRKDCESLEQARTLYQAVKVKLTDHPDIKISGCINQDAEPAAPPEPPE